MDTKSIINQPSLLPIFNPFIARVSKTVHATFESTWQAEWAHENLGYVERSDIECPFLSRAFKRVNVNIICDYSLDNVRAIHRPVQKSHDCGARTCERAQTCSII